MKTRYEMIKSTSEGILCSQFRDFETARTTMLREYAELEAHNKPHPTLASKVTDDAARFISRNGEVTNFFISEVTFND